MHKQKSVGSVISLYFLIRTTLLLHITGCMCYSDCALLQVIRVLKEMQRSLKYFFLMRCNCLSDWHENCLRSDVLTWHQSRRFKHIFSLNGLQHLKRCGCECLCKTVNPNVGVKGIVQCKTKIHNLLILSLQIFMTLGNFWGNLGNLQIFITLGIWVIFVLSVPLRVKCLLHRPLF